MSRGRQPERQHDDQVMQLIERSEAARRNLAEVKQHLGEAAAALDRAEHLLRESLGELSPVLPKRTATHDGKRR